MAVEIVWFHINPEIERRAGWTLAGIIVPRHRLVAHQCFPIDARFALFIDLDDEVASLAIGQDHSRHPEVAAVFQCERLEHAHRAQRSAADRLVRVVAAHQRRDTLGLAHQTDERIHRAGVEVDRERLLDAVYQLERHGFLLLVAFEGTDRLAAYGFCLFA